MCHPNASRPWTAWRVACWPRENKKSIKASFCAPPSPCSIVLTPGFSVLKTTRSIEQILGLCHPSLPQNHASNKRRISSWRQTHFVVGGGGATWGAATATSNLFLTQLGAQFPSSPVQFGMRLWGNLGLSSTRMRAV